MWGIRLVPVRHPHAHTRDPKVEPDHTRSRQPPNTPNSQKPRSTLDPSYKPPCQATNCHWSTTCLARRIHMQSRIGEPDKYSVHLGHGGSVRLGYLPRRVGRVRLQDRDREHKGVTPIMMIAANYNYDSWSALERRTRVESFLAARYLWSSGVTPRRPGHPSCRACLHCCCNTFQPCWLWRAG